MTRRKKESRQKGEGRPQEISSPLVATIPIHREATGSVPLLCHDDEVAQHFFQRM